MTVVVLVPSLSLRMTVVVLVPSLSLRMTVVDYQAVGLVRLLLRPIHRDQVRMTVVVLVPSLSFRMTAVGRNPPAPP
jgi:hypothetical protein